MKKNSICTMLNKQKIGQWFVHLKWPYRSRKFRGAGFGWKRSLSKHLNSFLYKGLPAVWEGLCVF